MKEKTELRVRMKWLMKQLKNIVIKLKEMGLKGEKSLRIRGIKVECI